MKKIETMENGEAIEKAKQLTIHFKGLEDMIMSKDRGTVMELHWYFDKIEQLILSKLTDPSSFGQGEVQNPDLGRHLTDPCNTPPAETIQERGEVQENVSPRRKPGHEYPASSPYIFCAIWLDAVSGFCLKNPLLTHYFDQEATASALEAASESLLQNLQATRHPVIRKVPVLSPQLKPKHEQNHTYVNSCDFTEIDSTGDLIKLQAETKGE